MGKWIGIVAAFLLVLPGCGSDDTPTRTNNFTPLTSIVITSAVVSLPVGVSTQLKATGNYSGLFSRDITSQVVWSSMQPGVADPNFFPSSPGRVKALVTGSATITATLAGVTAETFIQRVSDAVPTALTIAPLSPSRPKGLSQLFTAQGTFSEGTTPDLTIDVTYDVNWSSSDETVATISNDLPSKGKAETETTDNMGPTTISAQFGTFPPASTTLTVTAAILSKIEVSPVSLSLLSLSSKSLAAMGTYSDTTTRDVTTEVTWASSLPAVATVATTGAVNALTPGTSAISATLGSVSGTSNLKVTGGTLTTITLTLDQSSNNELIKDTVSRITARGTFDSGLIRDITGVITTWAVVDNTKASFIDSAGNLVWVKALDVTPTATPATLTATNGSVTVNSSLIVTAPTLNSLSIPEQTLSLVIDTSGRLSLKGTFSPSSVQDLTPSAEWSSASPAIATVDNFGLGKGRVHAVAPGTAAITATYGGQSATSNVTVTARTLESLTISAVTVPATIKAGTEKEYKVTARYSDASVQDVTADAVWSIDNLNFAKFSDSLSDPGLVVAVDVGTATLTAAFGGISDTETFVVSQ